MAERNNTGEKIAGGALAAYLAQKYGRRALPRWIDPEGFGNVSTSYKSAPKWQQALDNARSITGRRRDIPMQLLKTMKKKSKPLDIKAMKSKIKALKKRIAGLEDIWGKDGSPEIKKLKVKLDDALRLSESGLKERRMANAIKERSFKNKIGFSHEGKFIEGTYPQEDPTIKRALEKKGLNINKPIPVFDATDTSQSRKLVGLSQKDPRMAKVRKFMAKHQISKAKEYIKQFPDMSITKTGTASYRVQHVPHHNPFNRGLRPAQDFVMGGHTARADFGKFKGKKGLHRVRTSGLDVTTYVSEGETVKNSKGLQKVRALLGGRFGQNIGLHQPVVSTWAYDGHRAPGGGRKKGAKDKQKRMNRAKAAHKPYANWKKVEKSWKNKNLLKKLVGAAATIASRGKTKFW